MTPHTAAAVMPALFRYPFAFPPTGFALVLLCALYLLPGIIGHDPWKADDATHFGVAYSILTEGNWLEPHLAGEPYYKNPPLYYWAAALTGLLLDSLLPLHDAVRFASALFAALLMAAVAAATREWHGPRAGVTGVLLTVGSLGMLVHLHDVQPQTAVLSAYAGTFFGLALMPRRALLGGAVTGLAAGAGFLAGGLPSLALTLPLMILAPLASGAWRSARCLGALLLAVVLTLALAVSWPALLLKTASPYLEPWWAAEHGSLTPIAEPLGNLRAYMGMLPWFAWPVLPLAGWTLWRERRHLAAPGIMLPLLGFVAALVLLCLTLDARSANALPLLVPLILLATPGAGTLRRGAANALDWFAMLTFTLIAGLVWLGWSAMLFGWPARLAAKAARMEPGFVMEFSAPALAAALIMTLLWLWFIVSSPRAPERGTVHWAMGVTLMWCLVAALWLPWIEHGKSYRALSASMASAMQNKGSCVLGRDVGDAQRASFQYFASIVTHREGAPGTRNCRWLLVQSSGRNVAEAPPGPGWRKVWEGRRPGDRDEHFRLYRRS